MEQLTSSVPDTPEQCNLFGRMALAHLRRVLQPCLAEVSAIQYPEGDVDYHIVTDSPDSPNATLSESYLHYTTTVCNIRFWQTVINGEVHHDTSHLKPRQTRHRELQAPGVIATLDGAAASEIGLLPISPSGGYVHYARTKVHFAFFGEKSNLEVTRSDHFQHVLASGQKRASRPAKATELKVLHAGLSAGGCHCEWEMAKGRL